jgi:hypothetical protein
MSATPTPAPPQTLKAIDQNNEKINIGAYQDGSLQINNLDLKNIFQVIVKELQLIRKNLEVLTEEYFDESEEEKIIF